MIVAGVDVGNETTEAAVAKVDGEGGETVFVGSSLTFTTGMKGTVQNAGGIKRALAQAMEQAGLALEDLDLVRINEAAPVIGDVAMETITETIITESTMIGHNPGTPGGMGLGVGITRLVDQLDDGDHASPIIAIVPGDVDFAHAAKCLNDAAERGLAIAGAIIQNDDGVLINNRLVNKMPIVDEVSLIDKVALGMPAAVEVAPEGNVVSYLSNPYGLATIFGLTPEQTRQVVPVAKALIGTRSAVVIRTPSGDVRERHIPAGKLIVFGARSTREIDVDAGSKAILDLVEQLAPLEDVCGESGTNVGGMLERVRTTMATLTGESTATIKITDILAVDTMVPAKVKGGLAEEFSYESAVALAAMVRTSHLPMQRIAERLEGELGVRVEVAGVEANMAMLGALTTPGTGKPLVVLDMGAGSTDAALIDIEGDIVSQHLAGAGEMVTMIINSELRLDDRGLADAVKKYPLAKVESLYSIRLEDWTVRFFDEPLPAEVFARVVLLAPEGMVPVPSKHSLEEIRRIRRDAKVSVFTTNALRVLGHIVPGGNIKDIGFVVMVGGSALDFEVADFITKRLAEFGVVCGRGNIRGVEGPRNAVATGLVVSYALHQNAGSIVYSDGSTLYCLQDDRF